ncbi:hypothetical protein BU14_0103s0039 [Porphyra umbilicalis]|uniref:J domain-containing protein n=1 Tax=Porphyra umbilicalis TaxID=2786 RepID=A0A1X6PD85_PORUM|nr:hypothetical protein BU14_0103s0039 [Porphyra umbilicalis]|eukprot:OSX78696.1 hypothetical protein BU14_0103s0039 [Porphyra umbilicalis]
MATPLLTGAAVAGVAWLSRAALRYTHLLPAALTGAPAPAAAAAAAAAVPRAWAGGFEAVMGRSEAARILGLPVAAGAGSRRGVAHRTAVVDAHRRLMRLNHPDTGGSTFVASKVNEAKAVLLGGKGGGGRSVF